MMPSRGPRIRDYLRNREHPAAPAEIAAALGLPTLPVCHSIGCMYRAGMLGRVGAGQSYHYFLLREAQPREIYTTPEAKRARHAERARLAHKRKGGLTRDEYQAQFAAKRAAREEAARAKKADREARAMAKAERARVRLTPEEAAERRRERDRQRKARERTAKRLTLPQRMLAHDPPIPSKRLEAPPVRSVRTETVAEWMARTGQSPEVLPAVWNQHREAA